MSGLFSSRRSRIIAAVVSFVVLVIVIAPLFLGCQGGLPGLLPVVCWPGLGDDSYDISGDNFTIGRLATWRQSLFVQPYNVVTVRIDGTLDLVNEARPRTVQVNDLTLVQGGGLIRAGGDYNARPLVDGPIFGDGTLVLDGSLRLEAENLTGAFISMGLRGSRLLFNDHVTLSASGTTLTGVFVYGDLTLRYSGGITQPTVLVQGSESATGLDIADGRLDLRNEYLRVEGPESLGVTGSGDMSIMASLIEVPDGVAVQLRGDSSLFTNRARISGGVAAVQGNEGAQIVDLNGTFSGTINLGAGDDHLRLIQNEYLTLENGDISLGAGDDELTLDYSSGVIDAVLDGGAGSDKLIVTLKFTPGADAPSEADLAAANGSLDLPGFTLRWANFEDVQIAYASNSA